MKVLHLDELSSVAGRRYESRHDSDTAAPLREHPELLQQAFDAVIVTDLELRVTFWNAAATRLYGLTSDEVHGRELPELAITLEPLAFVSARAATIARHHWQGEHCFHRSPAGPRIVESTWTLIADAADHPSAILIVDRDATERRAGERQRFRAERLEGMAKVAGGIAHEINNALTPVTLGLDVLAEHALSAEDRELISQMQSTTREAAAVTGQLLAFARGAPGLRRQIDPAVVVARAAAAIRHELPVKIDLAVRQASSPWAIEADAGQLANVLHSLALRARAGMREGGRWSVALENMSLEPSLAARHPGVAPGLYVRISASDTGSGLTAGEIDRFFDPLAGSRAGEVSATLGVSVIPAVMRAHGGFVHVESEVGQGTTVHLMFPAWHAAPAEVDGPESTAMLATTTA